MKELIAIQILGLNKQEQALTALLIDLDKSNKYGEIPGRNLRVLLDLSKDDLFHLLEKLTQKNILKYTHNIVENIIYVKGGDGGYVYNNKWEEWTPVSDSLFYKLCKILKLRYNTLSYNYILNNLDIRNEFVAHQDDTSTTITPYELYGLFCKEYKIVFDKDYKPLNQSRDFQTIKDIICKFNYNNIKDSYITEFIKWCFMVKVRSFKSNLIIGFLPLCLQDYLKDNTVEKINTGKVKDENGNWRKV